MILLLKGDHSVLSLCCIFFHPLVSHEGECDPVPCFTFDKVKSRIKIVLIVLLRSEQQVTIMMAIWAP